MSKRRTTLDIASETHKKLKVTRDMYDFKSFDELLTELDRAFTASHEPKVKIGENQY
jgi:hypothetical protein